MPLPPRPVAGVLPPAGAHGAGGGLYTHAVGCLGAPGAGERRRSSKGARAQREEFCTGVELDAKEAPGGGTSVNEATGNGVALRRILHRRGLRV